MKTIIAGSRKILNLSDVAEACKACGWEITEVVSGCAPGVDRLGEQWAALHNIPVAQFPAHWEDILTEPCSVRTRRDGGRYNALAGLNRNLAMARYADALVAIWDGYSHGTRHMIETARKLGLKVHVHRPG